MPGQRVGSPLDPGNCEVCQYPLSAHVAARNRGRAPKLCDEPECRTAFELVKSLNPAARTAVLDAQRQSIRCRRDARKRVQQHVNWVNEVRSRQREEAYSKRDEIRPGWADQDVLVIDLPMMDAEIVPLPDERKTAFLEHARAVATRTVEKLESGADDIAEDVENAARLEENRRRFARMPELRVVSDSLCAACRGGCCARGGNKAYFTEATAVRNLSENEGWGVEELVQAWADYLPEMSVEGSCVFQTSMGCSLPRTLRSDTCNGFYCGSLDSLQKRALEEEALPPCIVLQRRGDLWGWRNEGRDHTVLELLVVDGDIARKSALDASALPGPGESLPRDDGAGLD